MSTIKGNSSANTLNGTSSADYIYGYGGNDTLNGYGGNDHLYGGDGSDHLNGGSGTDYLYGNAGNDYLDGGSGIDWMYGGDGNDVLYADTFQDHLDGGAGTDTLSFAKHTSAVSFFSDPKSTTPELQDSFNFVGGSWLNIEKVVGSPYGDSMIVRNHPGIVVDGAGGNDTLLGEGPITLYGGSGNDDLIWRGAHGANGTVGYGGSGNDHLNMMDMTGGTGNDTFVLMAYNDVTIPGGNMSGNNAGGIVRDFHHGEDHLQINTYEAGPGTLTHSGDLWTVHDQEGNFTFDLVGVTHLDPSDYSFA